MKVSEYAPDLLVEKFSNLPIKQRTGITLSDRCYEIERSSGNYCLVRWNDSNFVEEINIKVLRPLPTPTIQPTEK